MHNIWLNEINIKTLFYMTSYSSANQMSDVQSPPGYL